MSESLSPPPQGADGVSETRSHNILGGVIVTVLGLALLGFSFYMTNTTMVPRVMALLIAVVGVATAMGIIPVQAPRDFYGGLALVMLPTLALIASSDLPGQRGFAFGPGTAPRLFSLVLAALAAMVTVGGVFAEGPPIEKYKFRGPLLVIVGIITFALMIRPLGLFPATFLAFLISILGSTEMRWLESLIAAAAMTVFCWLLFIVLLNLPFQLWPRF
jgi:putative tricarboxylic transport membrane protein